MSISKNRALTLVAAFALAACQGDQGPAGTAGAQGAQGPAGGQGPKGDPGTSSVVTGTLQGTATFLLNGTGASTPASAVTVETLPPQVAADGVTPVTVTTDANGAYSFANVPVGVYAVRFSGNGYTALTVNAVSVVAGKTAVADGRLVAANPLTVTSAVANKPFGFGATVTLGVNVSGGSGTYTYSWVKKSANPTAAAPSDAAAAAPTVTLGTLADVIASKKAVGFGYVPWVETGITSKPNPAKTFLPVTVQQLAQMTYNFDCTVTDSSTGWVKTVTVAVPPATLSQGMTTVPVNAIVIANLPGNAAAPAFTAPAGSSAALNDAATPNPWFFADVTGDYTIAGLPVVSAAKFVSSNYDPNVADNCTSCHSTGGGIPGKANADAKFKAWSNSAHGNHFFKYMAYDAGGNLTWKAGVTQLPTANPLMSWKTSDMPVDASGFPLPMTTFEFGMTGAEGAHYSSSCMGCHTTGYNAAIDSGGADDAIKASGWTFNPATAFTGKLKTASATDTGEPVTVKPEMAIWNAMPASVTTFAGMQCEACHGPLGQHVATVGSFAKPAPKQEFDVAACAACHDRPTNHDRVSLWRQSGHANMEVAQAEGVGSSGNPSNSCNRCHTAQGFVQYVKQLQGELKKNDGSAIAAFPGSLLDPTATGVAPATAAAAGGAFLVGLGITPDQGQAITCAACHDPHSTEIRISGDTPNLPGGFAVKGAGTGAICFVCHNSRNGARNDFAPVVGGKAQYWNNPLPGMPIDATTAATSIGGPHEANQGDVLAGTNAFYMPMFVPSRHLAVKDTCVGCHMKTFAAGITGTNTNHTWKIDATSCKECHGEEVDGEALQGQFDAAADGLKATITSTAKAALANGFGWKGSARTVAIPAGAIATFSYVSGRSLGFTMTFNVAIENANAASGTIAAGTSVTISVGTGTAFVTLDAGGLPTTTKIFDALNGKIARANWNYALVEQDASRAIHNPTFVFGVISNTMKALVDPSVPVL